MESQRTTLEAPAKLTLSLRVTGVRVDGYHLLDAEMVTVDLTDELEFTEGEGITVVDEVEGGLAGRTVPTGPENLVSKALGLVKRRAAVRIVKRIPPGAGLGGGSADAAAVLRWAEQTDPDTATRLGADVPFCVRGGRARVTGIGDVVHPLPFEHRHFVVVMPPVAVSTAEVYARWDERAREASRQVPSSGQGPVPSGLNDLEGASLDVAPDLAKWRTCFFEAIGVRPRLAGSGAAWFVEGDPGALGLGERSFLVLGGERAPLVAVRSVQAEPST